MSLTIATIVFNHNFLRKLLNMFVKNFFWASLSNKKNARINSTHTHTTHQVFMASNLQLNI